MVPARAFENGLYVTYANHAGSDRGYRYLGESCMVGPNGRDLARAGAEPCVIGAVLAPEAQAQARRRIPFLRDSEGLEGLRRAR